jgi:hypothetical protein
MKFPSPFLAARYACASPSDGLTVKRNRPRASVSRLILSLVESSERRDECCARIRLRLASASLTRSRCGDGRNTPLGDHRRSASEGRTVLFGADRHFHRRPFRLSSPRQAPGKTHYGGERQDNHSERDRYRERQHSMPRFFVVFAFFHVEPWWRKGVSSVLVGPVGWGQSLGCAAGFPRTLGRSVAGLQRRFCASAFRVNDEVSPEGPFWCFYGGPFLTARYARATMEGSARLNRLRSNPIVTSFGFVRRNAVRRTGGIHR